MDTMTSRLPMIEWMGTVRLEPSIKPQILMVTQSTSSQVKMMLSFLHLTKDNKKRSMITTRQTPLSSQTQIWVIILMTILSKMASIIITEVLSIITVAFHHFLIQEVHGKIMEPCFNSIKTSLLHHQLIETHQVLLTEGIFTTPPLAQDLTRIVSLPLLSLEEEEMRLTLWKLAFSKQLLPTRSSCCSPSKKLLLALALMWKDGLATTTTPKLVFNQQLSKA